MKTDASTGKPVGDFALGSPGPQGGSSLGWEVEPWPESVDGGVVLDELERVLKRFVVLPKWRAESLALWVLHTYAFGLRDVSAYEGIESPEKRSGKTTLLTVLSELVSRPVVAANISSPAFFRVIEETQPTLVIDEADTFLQGNDELRGICSSGDGLLWRVWVGCGSRVTNRTTRTGRTSQTSRTSWTPDRLVVRSGPPVLNGILPPIVTVGTFAAFVTVVVPFMALGTLGAVRMHILFRLFSVRLMFNFAGHFLVAFGHSRLAGEADSAFLIDAEALDPNFVAQFDDIFGLLDAEIG
jgi:hypothetical protein